MEKPNETRHTNMVQKQSELKIIIIIIVIIAYFFGKKMAYLIGDRVSKETKHCIK